MLKNNSYQKINFDSIIYITRRIPVSEQILTNDGKKGVLIIDVVTGKIIHKIKLSETFIQSGGVIQEVLFKSDGRKALVFGNEGTSCNLIDLTNEGQPIDLIPPPFSMLNDTRYFWSDDFFWVTSDKNGLIYTLTKDKQKLKFEKERSIIVSKATPNWFRMLNKIPYTEINVIRNFPDFGESMFLNYKTSEIGVAFWSSKFIAKIKVNALPLKATWDKLQFYLMYENRVLGLNSSKEQIFDYQSKEGEHFSDIASVHLSNSDSTVLIVCGNSFEKASNGSFLILFKI